MRKYEELWLIIKRDGSVKITAPVPLHRRIIKATLKEKYKDLGYKLLMLEKNIVLELNYVVTNSVIEFRLDKRFKVLDSVSLQDL